MTPQEAASKLNYFNIAEDGVLEIYADHQMLSTLRTCEAKFMEEHVYHRHSIKAGVGGKYWSLQFGIWVHEMLEQFYNARKDGLKLELNDWMQYGVEKWKELEIENFKDDKKYILIGGLQGGLGLMGMYWAFFDSERMRVVDTEVSFGRGREVPIFDISLDAHRLSCPDFMRQTICGVKRLSENIRFYLCGRMDLIIDDGFKIGPLDHKTTSKFSGKEHLNFNPHEGMTGYLFALNTILKTQYPTYAEKGLLCNTIWINHLSLHAPVKDLDALRFKRTPIGKTPTQLEAYRIRQISSFYRLYDLIINERPADWNTQVCNNIYFQPCQFKALHECPPDQIHNIIQNYPVRIEQWNPSEKTKTVVEE